MRPLGFWRAAIAATALIARAAVAQDADNPKGQSTFISPSGDVSFAFTVPDNGNTDVFFSMRAHVDNSWAAVGLGSDDMKGALFLMMWRDDTGKNVTFSPRLAYGNYEPRYYPDLVYEVLPGTGVVDDYMVLVVKCIQHCRSWPAADSNSGYIDVSSPASKTIYALGPRKNFHSNDPAADLKMHREFGVFTIDMKRTQGSPDAPVLDSKTEAVGTALSYRKRHAGDYKAGLHGSFMVLAMCVLAFGSAIRLGSWVRWHSTVQSVGVVGILVGLALGVLTSFNYQRSRSFRSSHQILGFVLVGLILGQFALGFFHYQEIRKNKASVKFRLPHRGLGFSVLALGLLAIGTGFLFALNGKYGYLFAGVLAATAIILLMVTVGRRRLATKQRGPGGFANGPTGYQPQPWREEQHGVTRGGGGGYPPDPPPGYEPPSQQIGLQSVPAQPATAGPGAAQGSTVSSSAAASPWRSADAKDDEEHGSLGSVQRPREFA